MRISRGLPTVLVVTTLALAALASSAAARNVYVPNYDGDTVSVLDAGTGQVAAPTITMEAGSGPWTSAVAPDGKTAYIATYDGDYVVAIDTATNQVVGPKMPIGEEAYGIAITPDGKKAYVANTSDTFVSVLDLQAKAPLAPIELGQTPFDVTVSPNGKRLYVVSDSKDEIVLVNTETDTVEGAIPIKNPVAIAFTPDGKQLVVTGDEKVTFIDAATNQVIGTPIPVVNAYQVAVSPDGQRAYVADANKEAIHVIDVATRQALTPITLPAESEPEYLALSPDGKRLFASDYDREGVFTIDTATNQALGPLVKTGEGAGKISVVPDQSPTASLTPPTTKIRPGVPVTLSGAASTDPDGTIATYAWQFGDGGTATGPASTAAHTFAQPGEYKATLTLTDNEGCSVALVFTGATAYCHGSPLAAASQTVVVKYPGVKVKCPKDAGVKGCKFKLKAVKKTGKGKKKKLKAQSSVAKAKVKAGKSAIVALKPAKKAAAALATAKKTLVQQDVTIDGETTTKVGKLKIVE